MAFTPVPVRKPSLICDNKNHHRRIIVSSSSQSIDQQDSSIENIEDVRQQLEHLIGPIIYDEYYNLHHNNNTTTTNIHYNNNDDSSDIKQQLQLQPHGVVLTNAGRKRRQIEIELLHSLQYNDDAIDEIMSLWINECPYKIKSIDTIQFMSSIDSTCTLHDAEFTLKHIIDDCPIPIWTEPAARLAFVLYQQGKYDECNDYINAVLCYKPWHFEMIQLQLILYLSYYKNYNKAIQIARCGLPPMTQPKKRMKWVQNAIHIAQQQLQLLEQYTNDIHSSYNDFYYDDNNNNVDDGTTTSEHHITSKQFTQTTSMDHNNKRMDHHHQHSKNSERKFSTWQ